LFEGSIREINNILAFYGLKPLPITYLDPAQNFMAHPYVQEVKKDDLTTIVKVLTACIKHQPEN
jgi:hypothetical protein